MKIIIRDSMDRVAEVVLENPDDTIIIWRSKHGQVCVLAKNELANQIADTLQIVRREEIMTFGRWILSKRGTIDEVINRLKQKECIPRDIEVLDRRTVK